MKTIDYFWFALLAICVALNAFFLGLLRQRIERLDDRSARIVNVIDRHLDNHLEIGHGSKTNDAVLYITNLSGRTITFQMLPK